MSIEENAVAVFTVGLAADGSSACDNVEKALEEAGVDVAHVCLLAEAAGFAGVVDAVVMCMDACRRAEQAAIRAASEDGSTPIVVVLPAAARHASHAALRAGACGVVLSTDVDIALAPTLNAVRSGQVVVPLDFRHRIASPVLSFREKQVLGLVVLGYTNGEIARTLYLAESTVKSHLSSSFDKLGVRSRNEAARLIVDESTGVGAGILAITGGEANGAHVAEASQPAA